MEAATATTVSPAACNKQVYVTVRARVQQRCEQTLHTQTHTGDTAMVQRSLTTSRVSFQPVFQRDFFGIFNTEIYMHGEP